MSSRANARTLLREHPLFNAVDEPLRESLFHRGQLLTLGAGEILYSVGQEATQVFVLLEGALQIEYPKEGQTRGFVAAMIPAPGLLGECQTLHKRAWSGTGVAMYPLSVLAIDKASLEALILGQPRFALRVYQELSLRFLGAINAWKHQQKATPDEMIARYLLSHVAIRTMQKRRPYADIGVSQAEVGRATALRRETVNRFLRQLERKGQLQLASSSIRSVQTAPLSDQLPEQDKRLLVQCLLERFSE